MANAAHTGVIDVSTNDSTYTEVDGLNDVSFSPEREDLDTTDFKDTSAAHTRILGLSDGTFDLSGDYEPADTNGQVAIRSAFLNATDLYVRWRPDGTNGYKVKCLVTSFELSSSVDGKAEFSATCAFNGAITAV